MDEEEECYEEDMTDEEIEADEARIYREWLEWYNED